MKSYHALETARAIVRELPCTGGPQTLPPADVLALVLLLDAFGEPLSVGEVSRHLALPQASTTSTIKRAMRLGLVEANTDPADRRISRISLTPRGQRQRQRARWRVANN